jgi:hypothetical protein
MDLKRGLLTGVLLWVLIFFEVSILMFGFKLQVGPVYYLLHYILAAIFIVLCSAIYFNKKKIKSGLKEGFLLGITFLIVGLILDALITVSLFTGSFSFFNDIYLWLGYAETIVLTMIIATVKK